MKWTNQKHQELQLTKTRTSHMTLIRANGGILGLANAHGTFISKRTWHSNAAPLSLPRLAQGAAYNPRDFPVRDTFAGNAQQTLLMEVRMLGHPPPSLHGTFKVTRAIWIVKDFGKAQLY